VSRARAPGPVEFGVFLPVGQGGFIVSTTRPPTPATYEYNRAVVRLAEEMGLGFVISQARWRGFGGPSGHNDVTLESITTTAGLAEATERIKLFCTIHTMAFHPAVAAKMIATLDEISHGRVGINLVAGSNPIDHGQMGIWRDIDHAELYAVADEWLTVAQRLWTEERVDFDGQHYQLVDCMSNPKPVQKPRPPILCAATSDTGLRFTIQRADASLVNGIDVADLTRNGQRSKRLGETLGRAARTVGLVMLVPGETDDDAHARVRHFNAGADVEALAARAHEFSQGAKEWSRDETLRRETRKNFPDGRTPAAITRNAVIGSVDSLVEQISTIVAEGEFDWLGFYFPDYLADLELFGREVLPRLVRNGVGLQHSPRPSLAHTYHRG
jgi:pyrimidine oxygenase